MIVVELLTSYFSISLNSVLGFVKIAFCKDGC